MARPTLPERHRDRSRARGRVKGVSGSHAFSALEAVDAKGRRDWLSVTSVGGTTPDLKSLADRMTVDAGILASTRALIVPGTSLILTDAPVNTDTHSTSDFRVMTTSADEVDGRPVITVHAGRPY